MRFKHTKRPGFLLGFIDFFTAGLFFLVYMPLDGLQEARIDLGDVQVMAELIVNGHNAGLLWRAPYLSPDLLPWLHEGENTIEVKVTTLMSNYLQTMPDNAVAQRFVLRRNTPLMPAGLIGPVKLYR